MVAAAIFDLNRIIVHATRFTDEIFALLIAAIFIINALGNPFGSTGLYHYFKEDHPSHQLHINDPNYSYMASALLSVLIWYVYVDIIGEPANCGRFCKGLECPYIFFSYI